MFANLLFLSVQISSLPAIKITIYGFMKWLANRKASCTADLNWIEFLNFSSSAKFLLLGPVDVCVNSSFGGPLNPGIVFLVYCTQVNNQFAVNMLRKRKNHFYLISFLIACQITEVGLVLGFNFFFSSYAVSVLSMLKIDVFLSRRRLVNKQFPRPFRLQVLIITYLSY